MLNTKKIKKRLKILYLAYEMHRLKQLNKDQDVRTSN